MLAGSSHVHYVKEHLYYRLGDEMNVIDVDLEWPEKVDGRLVAPLQQWLAQHLFGVEADNFTDAYRLLKARYGVPVARKFDELPDSRKYCYADYSLKLMGHTAGKYISFALSYTSTPQPLSSQPADTVGLLMTYDLQRQQVLLFGDILRKERMALANNADFLATMIIQGRLGDFPYNITSLGVSDCCLVGDDVLMNVVVEHEEGQDVVLSSVDAKSMKPFLKKEVTELLKKAAPGHADELLVLPHEQDGQPVYDKVDVAPEYPDGKQALAEFIYSNINASQIDHTEAPTPMVVLSFVVGEDGSISDVAVVEQLSPSTDREAVRVAKMMRPWTPALIGGKAVKARVTLPIKFL